MSVPESAVATRSISRGRRRLGMALAITLAVVLSLAAVLGWLAHRVQTDPETAEAMLEAMLGRPVAVDSAALSLHGFTPTVRLRGLRLVTGPDATGAGSSPRLDHLEVVLDVAASLEAFALRSRRLRLRGFEIGVRPAEHGGWQLALESLLGNADAADRALADGHGWLETLFAQPELELGDIDLVLLPALGSEAQDESATGPRTGPSPAGPRSALARIDARIRPQPEHGQLTGQASVLLGPTPVTIEFTLSAPEPAASTARSPAPPAAPGWSVAATVTAPQTEVDALGTHLMGSGVPLAVIPSSGTLGASAKVTIDNDGSTRIDARVTGDHLAVARAHVGASGDMVELIALEQLEAHLDATLDGEGWRLAVREVAIRDDRGPWPLTRADIDYTLVEDPKQREPTARAQVSGSTVPAKASAVTRRAEIGLRADAFRLEHLRAIAGPYITRPAVTQLVERTRARGAIEQIDARLTIVNGALHEVHLDAAVRDMHTRPGNDIPGFRGIDGQVTSTLGQGQLVIDAPNASIEIPRLYDEVRLLGRSSATVHWSFDAEGGLARVEGAEVRSSTVGGTIEGDVRWYRDHRAPRLRASVHFDGAPYEHLAPWIRVRGIPAPVRHWMERALVAGTIDALRVSVDAPADELPFAAGPEGMVLEVDFRDAELAFAPRWPTAEALTGTLRLRGPRFDADIRGARALGINARRVRIAAPDLTRPRPKFSFQGQFDADSRELMRYLRQSPLQGSVDTLARTVVAEGPASLDVALVLDPVAATITGVEGTVTLRENRLSGIEAFTLESTDGSLQFDAGGLRQATLRAHFLHSPITLHATSDDGSYRIDTEGVADRAFLERAARAFDLAAQPEFGFVRGRTAWRCGIVVAPGSTDTARLDIASTLRGLELALPAPLGKSSEAQRPLEVRIDIDSPERRRIVVGYGDGEGLASALALQREGEGQHRRWVLERGAIEFGAPSANLPSQPGLTLRGRLSHLSIDAWRKALAPGVGGPQRSASGWRDKLRSVDLSAARLDLMGQTFDRVHLALNQDTGRWRARVRADDLEGTINWRGPVAGQPSPVVVRLKRLHLSEFDSDSQPSRTNPTGVPPLDIEIETLRLGATSLGKLTLSATPVRNGMRIEPLTLSGEGFDVGGKGRWISEGASQRTELGLRTQTDQLDVLLTTLGLGDAGVHEGQTDLHLDINWPGSPGEFSLAALSGTLFVRSKDGQLVDVKPGLGGRAFGLVNLASLPRALRLDFSHVFGDGFSYDKIEGSFRLAAGSAYTRRLRILGPSAKVELAGRTGFIARDYDQLITVTPRVTSSLPLAPLWLAEKVLRTDVVNRAFSTQYSITGSWDEPNITRIKTQTETEPSD